LPQAEAREGGLAAAADEFAADAVTGIITRFLNRDRHAALPQTDAKRQPGESAADNRDGFGLRHL